MNNNKVRPHLIQIYCHEDANYLNYLRSQNCGGGTRFQRKTMYFYASSILFCCFYLENQSKECNESRGPLSQLGIFYFSAGTIDQSR